VIRLVTGSSWTDIETILNFEVSDTAMRSRRDEWIDSQGLLWRRRTREKPDAAGISIGWAIDGATATTTPKSDDSSTPGDYSISTFTNEATSPPPVNPTGSRWACDGSSKLPTSVGPTTTNSDETQDRRGPHSCSSSCSRPSQPRAGEGA